MIGTRNSEIESLRAF